MAFWDMAAGLGFGGLSTIIGGITAISQKNQANKIHPVDPGFVMNQGIIDNAKTLAEKYNNYIMPGYATAKNNLDSSFAGASTDAREASSNSGDVLDSINKLDYNRNKAVAGLDVTNAQMKENLLPQVLQANAAAGNEYVLKNKFDEDRYQQQVAAKAALNQASAINGFKAADNVGRLGTAFLNYSPGGTTAKPAGGVAVDPSIFDSGMSVVNGYSAQKKNAAGFGFSNYLDPNLVA